jgi:hypothetical protein
VPVSSESSIPFGFPDQHFVRISSLSDSCHISRLSHTLLCQLYRI